MERLTKKDESGNAYYDFAFLNANHWTRGPHIDRLAAYEDTGMEPEEIKELSELKTSLTAAEQNMLNDYLGLGSVARLRELAEADKDGRCVVLPKEAHQPMFVKSDAMSIFDQWNDVTGAISNGTSRYYEAQSVVEEIAAMAFGAGIFYEVERTHSAEAALEAQK